MVIRFVVVTLLILAFLAGCADDASQQSVPTESQTGVLSASDTLAGAAIDRSELKIDSIYLRLDSGSTFKYKAKQFSEMTQDTSIATTNSIHYYTKNVKSKRSDGSFDVTMRFDSLNIDLNVRNRTTGVVLRSGGFNSRDTTQVKDPNNAQFASVLGENVTLILSANARIQEISGVSSVVNKIADRVPGMFQTQQQRDQAANYIEGMMYAAFIGQEFVPYPTKKLDSTLTWQNDQSSPVANVYTVNSTTTYKIVSVRMVKGHRIATIEASLVGTISPLPAPKEMGISIAISRSVVKGSSHAVLDLDNGMTVAKKNYLMLDVTATVKNKATGQQQTFTQKNETRYEVELIP